MGEMKICGSYISSFLFLRKKETTLRQTLRASKTCLRIETVKTYRFKIQGQKTPPFIFTRSS